MASVDGAIMMKMDVYEKNCGQMDMKKKVPLLYLMKKEIRFLMEVSSLVSVQEFGVSFMRMES